MTNTKPVISTFTFGYPRSTLKEGSKVKSDHIKRFPAHDFIYVVSPSQTCTTNNKRVISTFKFGYPGVTLKEGSKVKSDHTKRFPAHDYLLPADRPGTGDYKMPPVRASVRACMRPFVTFLQKPFYLLKYYS